MCVADRSGGMRATSRLRPGCLRMVGPIADAAPVFQRLGEAGGVARPDQRPLSAPGGDYFASAGK